MRFNCGGRLVTIGADVFFIPQAAAGKRAAV